MLLSIAMIYVLGLTLSTVFKKLNLPGLIGYLLAGILLGPYGFKLLDPNILQISSDLRKIALIIILLKAGLSLNLDDLKKVGRPAFLLSFLPASFEILAYSLIAPYILHISTLDALILGSVLSAVSPAVVVPKMVQLIESGHGKDKQIPQMILAGSSLDDVFVIVLFSTFTSMAISGTFNAIDLVHIPLEIILGITFGIVTGLAFTKFFNNTKLDTTTKVILLLAISFALSELEQLLKQTIPFSSLLAIMTMGMTLRAKQANTQPLSQAFSKLWIGAQVLLFVLVGAAVDINYTLQAGWNAVLMIFIALAIRSIGVFLALLHTNLNTKERLFTIIAYLPKATVQAAIGGVPLAMGLPCGQIVLSLAVVAILITAPLGALGMDLTYQTFLSHSKS